MTDTTTFDAAAFRDMVREFRAEMADVHERMQVLEEAARELGVTPPWQPAPAAASTGRVRHMDMRDLIGAVLSRSKGLRMSSSDICAEVNGRLRRENRPTTNPQAIAQTMRALQKEHPGWIEFLGRGRGYRINEKPRMVDAHDPNVAVIA